MSSSSNTSPSVTLRSVQPGDANALLTIYQDGIDTGNATFTEKASTWYDWDNSHLQTCRIAAVQDEALIGWAALSSVTDRCVYGGVAEVSIYVSPAALGRGVGSMLMQALIVDAESHGIWMLQAGIFPENKASITLHQNSGFRIVGMREKLGRMTYGPMRGKWRDVILLERRSSVVGTS